MGRNVTEHKPRIKLGQSVDQCELVSPRVNAPDSRSKSEVWAGSEPDRTFHIPK